MILRVISFLLILQSTVTFAQTTPYLVVLGVAQDGGYPHMGCQKVCCEKAWKHPAARRNVVSLALADPQAKKWWLFEASPDIRQQFRSFQQITKNQYPYLPEGVFITHAHIGHYTGLMEFGREVMGTKAVNVYVLPKLKTFIEKNGPWSQLLRLGNIKLNELKVDVAVKAGQGSVSAFTVPHRDEFSETAGFKIVTPGTKYLFIPDIDKWGKWDKNIIDEVRSVDIALLDATFYSPDELPGRSMAEVPHPLVTETINLFDTEPASVKKKIWFIHLNHTNPLLWDKEAQKKLRGQGYSLAIENEIIPRP